MLAFIRKVRLPLIIAANILDLDTERQTAVRDTNVALATIWMRHLGEFLERLHTH